MILSNVHIIGMEGAKDIHIQNGLITAVENTVVSQQEKIQFENAIAFPGLINSHDHLDFNLFPQLGNHIYNNYTEWANDIHVQNKAAMDAVLKIPAGIRLLWGIYKNLINGVTTVVNHGDKLMIPDELISVFQECYSLHSIHFEKNWKLKLNRPSSLPYVIHIGEGTDEAGSNEIDTLINWNLLKKQLIGIHGIAMNRVQAKHFKALVWCPASNYFLLGKTAAINELKENTNILFGTDSTLTAGWNLWDQLRLAREQKMLSDDELYNAVTSSAAACWKLDRGMIAENKEADIVVAKGAAPGMDSFYNLNPADILLVMHKGNIRLFDESIKEQADKQCLPANKFFRICVNDAVKYIQGDLPAVIEKIKEYNYSINFNITV